MQRRNRKFGLGAGAILGLALLAQPLQAVPPRNLVAADRADIACMAVLDRLRLQYAQAVKTDPKQQIAYQNVLQFLAYYVGKLVGRHPGSTPAEVAKAIDPKSPDLRKLADPTRCVNEVKAMAAH